MHLPFFAAVADGLFAEHGLDVELVESAPGSERVKLLATGAGDFLLTATLYHLQALAEGGPLPVRAVGLLHRRSPVAALVRADSDLLVPADVAGRRLGAPVGTQMGWLAAELQASLRARGLAAADVVDMAYPHAYAALARREIDVVAGFADLLPIDQRRAGTPLRAIPVGTDVHTSAVLAADAVPGELVERFVSAASASFERQRAYPSRGVDALVARYPSVENGVAVDSWLRFERYAFAAEEGAMSGMDRTTWVQSLSWIARTHDLPAVAVHEAVRTELIVDHPAVLL